MHKWMQIAYDEATDGMLKNDGGPFGAVIVKNDKIISQAHNEVLITNDPTAHAEINAIRKASQILNTFNLSDCILYTTCKPCPMCLGAIFWARINTIYYGSSDTDAQQAGFDDKLFYTMLQDKNNGIELNQIDQKDTKKLFEIWIKKEDKIIY